MSLALNEALLRVAQTPFLLRETIGDKGRCSHDYIKQQQQLERRGFPFMTRLVKMAAIQEGIKSFLNGLRDSLSGIVPIVMLAQG